MEITIEQFKKILTKNPYIDQWFHAISRLLPDYEINTPQRIASFLAQCKHESGNFTAIKENLNYKPESLMRVWPRYFPTMEIALQYAHNQEKIANRAYANRMGNGDEASGDGWRYCGRGLIQLTGKDNYQGFADSVSISVEEAPAYLETFEGAAQSACYFWEDRHLNIFADANDIKAMTKTIDGGYLGLEEREKNYHEILKLLGA